MIRTLEGIDLGQMLIAAGVAFTLVVRPDIVDSILRGAPELKVLTQKHEGNPQRLKLWIGRYPGTVAYTNEIGRDTTEVVMTDGRADLIRTKAVFPLNKSAAVAGSENEIWLDADFIGGLVAGKFKDDAKGAEERCKVLETEMVTLREQNKKLAESGHQQVVDVTNTMSTISKAIPQPVVVSRGAGTVGRMPAGDEIL